MDVSKIDYESAMLAARRTAQLASLPVVETAKRRRHFTLVRDNNLIGRNANCPCGSGKKFKRCHGKRA